jgi:putative hydrolase of the HAD superfamily
MQDEPLTKKPSIVAFDGDDTLWFHEHVFVTAQERIRAIMQQYVSESLWSETFSRIEIENLRHYGYGVKSFILSVLESATVAAPGRLTSQEVSQILEIGKSMLQQDVNVLQGAHDALTSVRAEGCRLVLITKGDPVEQSYKLEASGLVELFDVIEIVREKTPDTYRAILAKLSGAADTFVMVGNTIKSDVLPVLDIGGRAIHIPHELVWEHEAAPAPLGHPRFAQAPSLEAVPPLIANWFAAH